MTGTEDDGHLLSDSSPWTRGSESYWFPSETEEVGLWETTRGRWRNLSERDDGPNSVEVLGRLRVYPFGPRQRWESLSYQTPLVRYLVSRVYCLGLPLR